MLSHGANQIALFDPDRWAKLERLARAADELRDRFGFSAIQLAVSLGAAKHE